MTRRYVTTLSLVSWRPSAGRVTFRQISSARVVPLAAGAAAFGILTVGAVTAPAWADPFADQQVLGPLAIEPATGDLETYMTLTSGGGCPHGTNSITRIYGEGFPADGENVIGNTEVVELSGANPDRMSMPVMINLAEAVRRQAKPVTLSGGYTFKLDCQPPLPTKIEELYGVYVGKMTVTDGRYTAITTPADLPDPPSPKMGAEALAAPPMASPPPGAPDVDALAAAAKEREEESAKAAADKVTADKVAAGSAASGGGDLLPLAVGAGILVAGLGGVVAYVRRPVREPSGREK